MKRYSVIRDFGVHRHVVYDHVEERAVTAFLWKRHAKRHARYLNQHNMRVSA